MSECVLRRVDAVRVAACSVAVFAFSLAFSATHFMEYEAGCVAGERQVVWTELRMNKVVE